MTIAQDVREAGNAIAGATGEALVVVLNASIEQYTGSPYKVVSGRILDRYGVRTEAFGTVVCAVPDNNLTDLDAIPADSVAAVIEVHETLDLDGLRTAYGCIAAVKMSWFLYGNVLHPLPERRSSRYPEGRQNVT